MKRAGALKALDDAFANRLDRMLQNLADAYEGSSNAKAKAQENFARGVGHSIEALAFATDVITAHLKDEP